MNASIHIRHATEADVDVILELVNYEILNSTVLYEYEPHTMDEQLHWFKQKMQHGWPVIVAEYEGMVVGFGTFGKFRERIAYRFSVEHSVYVNHRYHGKGIGRALLNDLISTATDRGFHTMIAGIDSSNAGSIEFHRKLGFAEVGTFRDVGFKFDRWLHVTFMQRMLFK
jgi:phosphinothricin acetyltransferase